MNAKQQEAYQRGHEHGRNEGWDKAMEVAIDAILRIGDFVERKHIKPALAALMRATAEKERQTEEKEPF